MGKKSDQTRGGEKRKIGEKMKKMKKIVPAREKKLTTQVPHQNLLLVDETTKRLRLESFIYY